jgi:hypothetical protein
MAAACAMLLGTLVLLLLVIDSGVIVGRLRGGRLQAFRVVRLKALPLLVAALVLQVLLGLPWHQAPGNRWGFGAVLVVSLLLLMVVVSANGQLPGIPGAQFLAADPETCLPMLGTWAGSSVSRPSSVSETSCSTSACSRDSRGS